MLSVVQTAFLPSSFPPELRCSNSGEPFRKRTSPKAWTEFRFMHLSLPDWCQKSQIFSWQISRINCSLSWSASNTPKVSGNHIHLLHLFTSFSAASELNNPFGLMVVKARKGPRKERPDGAHHCCLQNCYCTSTDAHSLPFLAVLNNIKTPTNTNLFDHIKYFRVLSCCFHFPFLLQVFTCQAEAVTYGSKLVKEVRKSQSTHVPLHTAAGLYSHLAVAQLLSTKKWIIVFPYLTAAL